MTEIAHVSKRQQDDSNLGPLYWESDVVLVHSVETCCVERNISGRREENRNMAGKETVSEREAIACYVSTFGWLHL